MAKTGAPTTGRNPPKTQEMIEMIRQTNSPAQFFDRNDIKTSEKNTPHYNLFYQKSKIESRKKVTNKWNFEVKKLL